MASKFILCIFTLCVVFGLSYEAEIQTEDEAPDSTANEIETDSEARYGYDEQCRYNGCGDSGGYEGNNQNGGQNCGGGYSGGCGDNQNMGGCGGCGNNQNMGGCGGSSSGGNSGGGNTGGGMQGYRPQFPPFSGK